MAVKTSAIEASAKIKYLGGGSATYGELFPDADVEKVYDTVRALTSLQTKIGTNIYMVVVNELEEE